MIGGKRRQLDMKYLQASNASDWWDAKLNFLPVYQKPTAGPLFVRYSTDAKTAAGSNLVASLLKWSAEFGLHLASTR